MHHHLQGVQDRSQRVFRSKQMMPRIDQCIYLYHLSEEEILNILDGPESRALSLWIITIVVLRRRAWSMPRTIRSRSSRRSRSVMAGSPFLPPVVKCLNTCSRVLLSSIAQRLPVSTAFLLLWFLSVSAAVWLFVTFGLHETCLLISSMQVSAFYS